MSCIKLTGFLTILCNEIDLKCPEANIFGLFIHQDLFSLAGRQVHAKLKEKPLINKNHIYNDIYIMKWKLKSVIFYFRREVINIQGMKLFSPKTYT